MFCRNCGNPIADNQSFCINCGSPKGAGTQYCPTCGDVTLPGVDTCANCGNPIPAQAEASQPTYQQPQAGSSYQPQPNQAYQQSYAGQPEQKSKLAAGLLNILLPFGIGRFYLGYTTIGLLQLLLSLCGVGAIWSLVDGIMILTGSVPTDANGIPLKD